MKILKPASAPAAYGFAATAFQTMYAKITGRILPIITEDDGDTLVVIGSDGVNLLCGDLHIRKKITLRIHIGSDDYHILSYKDENRRLLLLAGGRGRSTIYAVYRYFELYCGCHYFWDGDVVPHATDILLDNIDLHEAPHFAYRGIRYFAHRSLHRFQAEHWSYEDWTREIDWLLKKRLNLFMLRIGDDDLFQRAFPDIVDYPSETERQSEDNAGYNDRTSAWPLRYRGELRKKVLDYAFSNDLMHPEDCGTMTHWYTPTPQEFMEAEKPSLLSQSTADYSNARKLVWDIRDDRNLNNYFKLTETHIRDFGRPDLFHTIGLAERMYTDDREANLRLKTYAYHRIAAKIAADYPNAPLFIASWDLYRFYTPEEVSRLLKTFDPKRTILLDYTSDSMRRSNFTNWNVVGKFPWIFGIFHAFESDSDIHGFYPLIESRLAIAKDDPMCKGFILWPELSHSDTFMTEYVAQNAWAPQACSLDAQIETYCHDRYGDAADALCKVWMDFWPLVTLTSWSVEESGLSHKDCLTDLFFYLKFVPQTAAVTDMLAKSELYAANAVRVLEALMPFAETADAFIRRDLFDIARTVCKRYIQYCLRKIEALYLRGEDTAPLAEIVWALTEALTALLGQNEEYSLYYSYQKLCGVHAVHPHFEETLLENASCQYCRTQIYEVAEYLYLPELRLFLDMLRRSVTDGVHPDCYREEYIETAKENTAHYKKMPLEKLKPKEVNNGCAVRALLQKISTCIQKI